MSQGKFGQAWHCWAACYILKFLLGTILICLWVEFYHIIYHTTMSRAQKACPLYIKQKINILTFRSSQKLVWIKVFDNGLVDSKRFFTAYFGVFELLLTLKKNIPSLSLSLYGQIKAIGCYLSWLCRGGGSTNWGKTKKQNSKQKLLRKESPTPISDRQTDRQKRNKHIAQNKFDFKEKFIKLLKKLWDNKTGGYEPAEVAERSKSPSFKFK